MNVLVIGFPDPDLRALSQLLSDAGHGVLAAPGRDGARSFAAAVVPDVVAVPEGPRGVEVAGWLDPLPSTSRLVTVPVGPEAVTRVGGQALAAPPAAKSRRKARATTPAQAPQEVVTVTEYGISEGVLDPVPEVAPTLAPPLSALPEAARAQDPGLERPELHPELAARLTQVRLADYFTLLEVEPEASTWVIREAHERLARRFSARGWPHRLSPLELEALDEVGRGLADALLVLGDDDLRVRYQRALAAAAQGLAQPAGSPAAPRSHA